MLRWPLAFAHLPLALVALANVQCGRGRSAEARERVGDGPVEGAAPVVPGREARLLATPASKLPELGPPELVHFVGRFDRSDPAGPRFDWSGSTLIAQFEGPAIVVNLKDEGDNFFNVQVDDRPPTTLAMRRGVTRYPLAEGLAPGRHRVQLFKRTEAMFSTVQFLGFEVPEGALVPASYPRRRRIEIVGDSISAGYGNEGSSPCPFTGGTENAYLAYGSIAGRNLDADVTTIAWSGHGMVRNYDGTSTALVPSLYEQTLGRGTGRWSFDEAPDVVLVNLGTNDYAKGDPGPAFMAGFVAFTTKLRQRYPSAFIFVAQGSMIADRASRDALTGVVAAREAEGDTRIAFLQFPQQQAVDGFGCDGHPSLKTHAKMGAVLTTAIRDQLGW